MPDQQRHLQYWQSNDALSQRLEREGELDWAVTTMFYSALHLVDAVLSQINSHPRSHGDRDRAMSRVRVLQADYPRYREMSERSRDASYECIAIPANRVQDLRTNEFSPLQAALRAHLGV